MNFETLSNSALINTLKVKVDTERKLLMEILYALQEVELRKLHLEMSYPDLYTFAMQELGYSSGAAYRRISAMRLLKTVPEVAPRLESGELALENASQAQSFFRKEDLRRKERGVQRLTLDEKREVVSELIGKSTREGQRILMERSPDVMMPTEKVRPLPEQKTLVQFVATAELMEKLEELKHLLAHKNYEGRMDILVEQLAELALDKLRPRHLKSESAAKSSRVSASHQEASARNGTGGVAVASSAPGMGNRSRYIPTEERARVFLRDQKGCTYKDSKTGRVCGSRHGLQFDHIVPYSLGGQNLAENLTLRCGAHNRHLAERMCLIQFKASARRAV